MRHLRKANSILLLTGIITVMIACSDPIEVGQSNTTSISDDAQQVGNINAKIGSAGVRGYTFDGDSTLNNILPSVTVVFNETQNWENQKTVISDTAGYYSASLKPGTYYVRAMKNGYSDFSTSPSWVTVSVGTYTNFYILMSADATY